MKNNLIDTIFRLNRDCLLQRQGLLDEYGLSHPEFGAIELLDGREALSCHLLAEKLALSVSRASRITDSLVKKGFLNREYDPDNRRVIRISLTDKGIRCKDSITNLKQNCERRILSRIEKANLSMVEKSMDVLAESLERA